MPVAAKPVDAAIDMTDVGNAKIFARFAIDRAVYVAEWNRWYVWDGQRWQPDHRRQVEQIAREVITELYQIAAGLTGSDQKEMGRHATSSASEVRINAMIRLARSEEILQPLGLSEALAAPRDRQVRRVGVTVMADEFDRDPWLLACQNGTVDLRSGKVRHSLPEDRITKISPVEYDPDATCPRWEQFLSEVLTDPELVSYIQRVVGYSLTGDTREQCMFILHGTGANGKSVFMETVLAMAGDYGIKTPSETLMTRAKGAIPNDVARLKGSRLVVASETEDGRRLAESRIKELTGSDTTSARFMYGELFDFKPICKLFLSTNHRPQIRGVDEGIWRRLHLIPFVNQFTGDRCDRELPEKLLAELPGILAWAVRGAIQWQQQGLEPPELVRSATSAYREQEDTLAAFLSEECVQFERAEVPVGDLYEHFQQWCKGSGEAPITKRNFGMRMHARGFSQARSGQIRRWLGIGLSRDG